MRKELILFIPLFAFVGAMQMWGTDQILDSRFFYTSTEASSFFANLSVEKTKAYVRNEIFDLGLIVTYTFLLITLLRRFRPLQARIWVLALLPGAFDSVETGTIISILLGVIAKPPFWLGFVTSLKWISGGLIILYSILGKFTHG